MGRANLLQTLFFLEKYKTNINDVSERRRYSWNILQWSKNDLKSMITTNGDYWVISILVPSRILNWDLSDRIPYLNLGYSVLDHSATTAVWILRYLNFFLFRWILGKPIFWWWRHLQSKSQTWGRLQQQNSRLWQIPPGIITPWLFNFFYISIFYKVIFCKDVLLLNCELDANICYSIITVKRTSKLNL